jgi:hypothetical protein
LVEIELAQFAPDIIGGGILVNADDACERFDEADAIGCAGKRGIVAALNGLQMPQRDARLAGDVGQIHTRSQARRAKSVADPFREQGGSRILIVNHDYYISLPCPAAWLGIFFQ